MTVTIHSNLFVDNEHRNFARRVIVVFARVKNLLRLELRCIYVAQPDFSEHLTNATISSTYTNLFTRLSLEKKQQHETSNEH